MIHSVKTIYFFVPGQFSERKLFCSFDFLDEFIEVFEISSTEFLISYEVDSTTSPFGVIHYKVEVDSKNDFYNISFNTLKSILYETN